IEEPRVLNGDYGLRGEILHKLDLLFREWTNLLAIHGNCADEFALLEHRDCYKGPCAANFDERNNPIVSPDIGLIGLQIGYLDNLFCLEEEIDWGSRIVAHIEHRIAAQIDVAFLAIDCNRTKDVTLAQKQMPKLGLTNASGIRQHGIEDGLKLSGGA